MERCLLYLIFFTFSYNIGVTLSNQNEFIKKIITAFEENSEINNLRIKRSDTNTSSRLETHVYKVPKSKLKQNNNITIVNHEDEKIDPEISTEIPKKEITDETLVTTESGTLQGRVINRTNIKYFSFSGIPYAEKPIRFQPSKPVIPWSGIKSALNESEVCAQKLFFLRKIYSNEDCLYLNINTPSPLSKNLPVVVWIYGGGFKFGTASNTYYDPERFIEEGIILITVCYRVGAFGFLSTNTKEAPGNVGLKDIVMALRWVKKNIRFFGGDENNICLYGVSSGGASVEYLTLSPMSKGLYHKAIIQSGSVLDDLFYIKNPIEKAFKLGRYLGFTSKNVNSLVSFLREADADDIVLAQEKMDSDDLFPFYVHFAPTTEEYNNSNEVFLSESPEKIMSTGQYDQIPMLFGITDKEGLYFLINNINIERHFNDLNGTLEYVIPPYILNSVNTQAKREILQKIKSFYFNNKTLGADVLDDYVNYVSDVTFLYGVQKSVEIRSKNSKSPLFYYEFAYDDNSNIYEYEGIRIKGVGHAEDVRYSFKLLGLDLFDEKSRNVSKQYIKMYSNFVRYNNPTPNETELLPIKWLPVEKDHLRYLRITENIEMKESPNEKRYAFWNKIYSDYKYPKSMTEYE